MIVLNHERYGMRTEFASVDEAIATVRACGEPYAHTTLHVEHGNLIDDRGECVGEEIDADD